MKNTYFTPANIEQKSKDFQSKISYRSRSNEVDWTRPALLVLDMQEFFLNEDSHAFVPSSTAILPKIKEAIHEFNKNELPIIFTKHINTQENAKHMAVWWKDLLTKDNPLCQISTFFETKKSLVIEKPQYDAFFQTNLDSLLEKNDITDIVITGVMTHLCCETTARSAFVRGYNVWFPIDGTATYNADFHLSSLTNLSHGFANIVLMEKILDKLSRE